MPPLRAHVRLPVIVATLALLTSAALAWPPTLPPAAPPAGAAPAVAPRVAGRLAALAAGEPAAPATTTIDAPSPTCVRSIPGTAACYVTWSYIYVTLNVPSTYVISLTVSIDDRLRAVANGFFQTNLYMPPDMFRPGFKVACGALGASSDPALGATYRTLLLARATDGTAASTGASVTCPADLARLYLPDVRRQ